MNRSNTAVAVSIALSALPAITFGQADGDMIRLAKDSGCYICHSVEPRNPAREVLTEGPAFRDIARRYKGQADAADRLTATILQGSGAKPSDKHWKGKVSGDVMPANAIEISEPDARKLAYWILSLRR